MAGRREAERWTYLILPRGDSAGESFFNLEAFVAPGFKGVKPPPGVPGSSVISNAVFSGVGSILRVIRASEGVAAGIRTVAERTAPLSNAFGRRGTFWSGGDIAKADAAEVAAHGGGITVNQTAGGAFLEWLENAATRMDIGIDDLRPAWKTHSGKFTWTVDPEGARAVLRPRPGADLPVPRSGIEGSVFADDEYPTLGRRGVGIEYVEAGEMGMIRQMPAVTGFGKGSIIAGNMARLGAGALGTVPANDQQSQNGFVNPTSRWFRKP